MQFKGYYILHDVWVKYETRVHEMKINYVLLCNNIGIYTILVIDG